MIGATWSRRQSRTRSQSNRRIFPSILVCAGFSLRERLRIAWSVLRGRVVFLDERRQPQAPPCISSFR
jgi:hypothetical protein